MIKMSSLVNGQARNAAVLTLVVTLMCAGLLVSGCGQKGPLFIPETTASEEPEDSDS
jgi:predicted small lipoprotein YifL